MGYRPLPLSERLSYYAAQGSILGYIFSLTPAWPIPFCVAAFIGVIFYNAHKEGEAGK